MTPRPTHLLALVLVLVAAACGGGDDAEGASSPEARDRSVTLLTHDSFSVSDDVLAAFEADTGIEVELLPGGDTGRVVNQAVLTKDDPIADVLYGIDNTFLTRALDEDIFVPYEAEGLESVPPELRLDPQSRVTPIDYGDVCLNYDRAFFGEEGLAPPSSLDDLIDPAYAGLTVVEDAALSSPGLAFLLATIARYGEDGWRDWWRALRDNDVLVAPDWESAYFGEFSGGGGGGERPIVVSYASSPPADIVFADEPKQEPDIAVVDDACFRQVEFAGILRGTDKEDEARELIDFLLSVAFQEDMPLNMYVFPVRPEARLPEVFERWAVVPTDPLTLDPDTIGANRDEWIEEWTDIVVR